MGNSCCCNEEQKETEIQAALIHSSKETGRKQMLKCQIIDNSKTILEYIPKNFVKTEKLFEVDPFVTKALKKIINDEDYVLTVVDKFPPADSPSLGPYLYKNDQNTPKIFFSKNGKTEDTTYVGQYVNGLRQGFGTLTTKSGLLYKGYFYCDKFEGPGTAISLKQKIIRGNFKKNRISQSMPVNILFADGSEYIGQVTNSIPHGLGELKTADGSIYKGFWLKGVKSGTGTEILSEGIKYSGEYKNGWKHGEGVAEWPDGSKYKGNFFEGNIEGTGVQEWPDGRRYEGEWKENMMHGVGTFTWPDGKKYVGEYKEDEKNGLGKFYW